MTKRSTKIKKTSIFDIVFELIFYFLIACILFLPTVDSTEITANTCPYLSWQGYLNIFNNRGLNIIDRLYPIFPLFGYLCLFLISVLLLISTKPKKCYSILSQHSFFEEFEIEDKMLERVKDFLRYTFAVFVIFFYFMFVTLDNGFFYCK